MTESTVSNEEFPRPPGASTRSGGSVLCPNTQLKEEEEEEEEESVLINVSFCVLRSEVKKSFPLGRHCRLREEGQVFGGGGGRGGTAPNSTVWPRIAY
jgi:hypothetical protein